MGVICIYKWLKNVPHFQMSFIFKVEKLRKREGERFSQEDTLPAGDGTSGFTPADLIFSEGDFWIQRENIISRAI